MKAQSLSVLSEEIPAPVIARVPSEQEVSWFDGLLADKHDLGAGRPVGDYIDPILQRWNPLSNCLFRSLWLDWRNVVGVHKNERGGE